MTDEVRYVEVSSPEETALEVNKDKELVVRLLQPISPLYCPFRERETCILIVDGFVAPRTCPCDFIFPTACPLLKVDVLVQIPPKEKLEAAER